MTRDLPPCGEMLCYVNFLKVENMTDVPCDHCIRNKNVTVDIIDRTDNFMTMLQKWGY